MTWCPWRPPVLRHRLLLRAEAELERYRPDDAVAAAIAAVRTGRFRDPGRLTRGPLGLGTDFESVREYTPDDDIRQVNWLAARLDRPMSNSTGWSRTGR